MKVFDETPSPAAHEQAPSALPRWRRYALRALLICLPVLALFADKGVVPWLLVTAVLAVNAGSLGRQLRRWDKTSLAMIPAFLAYAALSAAWSPDAEHALALAARIAATMVAGGVLISAFTDLASADRADLRDWLLAGLALAVTTLVAERLSDFALWRLLHEPEASRYHLVSGFNRGITLLTLLVWPAALSLARRWGVAATAASPLAVAAVIAGYESGAGIAAILVGIVVAGVAWLRPGLAFALLVGGLTAAFVGLPAILRLAPDGYLAQLDGTLLPATVDVRVEIWRFVAARFLERPVAGWGLDAARFMTGTGPWPGESPIRLHPHNNPLQLLMELGLLAALPVAVWLGILARRASRVTTAAGRAGFAGFFATALVIASTAYGLWQTQWLASLLAAVAVLMLAGPTPRREDGQPPT